MKGIPGFFVAISLYSSLSAWAYEQVDGPGDWAWIEAEVMPGGPTCICYQDSVSGHIFVSRKDGVWLRDDLGRWTDNVGHHLVIGPGQKPAVLLGSDTLTTWAVLTDSGWSFTSVRHGRGRTFLAFDSSGNPALYSYCSFSWCWLSSAYQQSGEWTEDTMDVEYHDALWWHGPLSPTTFVLGPGNRFYNDRGHFVGYTMGGDERYVETGHTGAWEEVFQTGGQGMSIWGGSLAVSSTPDFAACYDINFWHGPHGFFCCNAETVETMPAGKSRVRFDSRDFCQIVYALDVMKHAYRTDRWHIDTLPPVISDSAWDFAIDAGDRPLIAFADESGIFLAQGDEVACEEQRLVPATIPPRLPTIVRGVIVLPAFPSLRVQASVLLDASGRNVIRLHPGANDVSRLAPGVYFVREGPSAVSREPSAVHKVIVAR